MEAHKLDEVLSRLVSSSNDTSKEKTDTEDLKLVEFETEKIKIWSNVLKCIYLFCCLVGLVRATLHFYHHASLSLGQKVNEIRFSPEPFGVRPAIGYVID